MCTLGSSSLCARATLTQCTCPQVPRPTSDNLLGFNNDYITTENIRFGDYSAAQMVRISMHNEYELPHFTLTIHQTSQCSWRAARLLLHTGTA